LIHRILKPVFLLIDTAGYGDFINASLVKSSPSTPNVHPALSNGQRLETVAELPSYEAVA